MASNVILNLADTSGADIVNAAGNLQQRSSSLDVQCFDLFDLIADDRATQLHVTGTDRTKTLAQVQAACNSASKVIVSTHGPTRATDYGVIKDNENKLGRTAAAAVPNVTGHSVQLSVDEIGDLLARVFDTSRKYYIVLLVCYAARTGQADRNHSIAGALDWSDSFACKLFAKLCEGRTAKLKMSARTGQHGFSRTTGLSEVQSEAAVLAEIEALADAPDDLNQWIEQNRVRAYGRDEPGDAVAVFTRRFQEQAGGLMGPQKVPVLRRLLGADEGRAMAAADRQRFQTYLERMERDARRLETAEHYGKIYYYFDPGRQQIAIKRDSRNRIGWHSKSTLQEVGLAGMLGGG